MGGAYPQRWRQALHDEDDRARSRLDDADRLLMARRAQVDAGHLRTTQHRVTEPSRMPRAGSGRSLTSRILSPVFRQRVLAAGLLGRTCLMKIPFSSSPFFSRLMTCRPPTMLRPRDWPSSGHTSTLGGNRSSFMESPGGPAGWF